MDTLRWERIQALFHDAADLPESEQQPFLNAACNQDATLVADVLSLLREDAQGSSLLDRDAAHVAHVVLGGAGQPSLVTEELGPYRIKKILGEGGMGVVYLAERTDLGSLVAIKLLRDPWLSPSRCERFASEQRVLAQLNHPSIARLYDADTLSDGTPCLVMEYVEGIALTEYCTKHQCSIERRLQLFMAVCEAVEHAHQHAIIHRDLKPSNILVKSDGSVRLLDFGIAKKLDSRAAAVDQTLSGMRLMTPAYAAPEQVRGDPVGVHTDVYSLGVILYELLAGRLPLNLANLTDAEAATAIVVHQPAKPSALAKVKLASGKAAIVPAINTAGWADLDVLCLTAMHKDPQRRYRSVEALIRDINHYLKNEPLEARPDSLPYRVGKFVQRNRRSVIATALFLIAVVALVIFFTLRIAKARDVALAEAARTQRVQQFLTNLFEGGDEAAGPSDSLRVVTILDRGVQQAQSLNKDPRVQAELYQDLGVTYQKLGELDRADSLLRSALERRIATFGGNSPEVAESLIALGLLRSNQARLEEAEQLVRQGLEITRRHAPSDDPAVAKATAELGKVLEDRGQYQQSIQLLDEAVRLQSASGITTPDLAASLSELANSHFYAGHYDLSESLNRRVLEMHRKLYGERHPLVADTLINLGAIQYDLGHYAEAEQFDRQALDITASWYGKDHPETASALTILGRALVAQHRTDEAAELLQQALTIQEHVYGKVHPRVASALNELGKLAQQQGKMKDAEADFQRMADIYHSVYGDHHYLIAIALSNLASVYLDEGRYAHAEQLFRDVIRRFTEALSATHLNTGIARIKLGRALLRQHRYPEAEVESRAGYEILVTQASPSVSWLKNARTDLAEEYAALRQPANAAKFRAEQAEGTRKSPSMASTN
jgi:serine/threonine protein kinase/tetratricopeptide (TPR) repeat protein